MHISSVNYDGILDEPDVNMHTNKVEKTVK